MESGTPPPIDLVTPVSSEPARFTLPAPGFTAELVHAPRASSYEFCVQGRSHYLALHDLVLRDGLMQVQDSGEIRRTDLRGTLTYFPQGIEARGWCSTEDRAQSFTALYFDESAIPEELRQSSYWRSPLIYFRSRPLAQALDRLGVILRSGAHRDKLLAETLCDLVIAEFAHHRAAQDRARVSHREALRQNEVARVHEYMRANLERDLSLDELARVLGISRFHFARCYKQATGSTAYRDLLSFRTQRAQQLIASGASPSEAARACGLQDAARLGRTLRAITGRALKSLRPQRQRNPTDVQH